MKRLAAVLLATAALLGAGCGWFPEMRDEFVALRYVQSAESHLRALPRNTPRAIAELDRAVALKSDDLELMRRVARLYTAARAWEKAIPLYEAQDELTIHERTAYAHSLLNADRTEEGAQICLEIIDRAMRWRARSGPRAEWALLLNDAGYILADANMHVDRAYEAVEAAVEAMPLQGAFIDSLGWALYRRGELADAAFYLERARRHTPEDDPEILYHLGVVYARQGRFGEASVVLERARELAPHWDVVQKELRRLGRILPPPDLAAHGVQEPGASPGASPRSSDLTRRQERRSS